MRAAAASAEVVHSDAGGSSTGTLHGELKRYRRGECMHAGATAGEAGRASSAAPRPGAVPGGAACLGCVALGKQLRAIARVLVEHALDHSPHLVDHACTHGLRTQRSHHRRVPQCRPPQAQRRPNGGPTEASSPLTTTQSHSCIIAYIWGSGRGYPWLLWGHGHDLGKSSLSGQAVWQPWIHTGGAAARGRCGAPGQLMSSAFSRRSGKWCCEILLAMLPILNALPARSKP